MNAARDSNFWNAKLTIDLRKDKFLKKKCLILLGQISFLHRV